MIKNIKEKLAKLDVIKKLKRFVIDGATTAVGAIWLLPFPMIVGGVLVVDATYTALFDKNKNKWYNYLAGVIGTAVGAGIAIKVGVGNWGF